MNKNHIIRAIFAFRRLIFLALAFVAFSPAQADLPFRQHRYDAFSVLPVTPESIVFYGNSITNMHEWCEALGNDNVLNRGVSGCVTSEMLDNLHLIIAGHPAKILIMGGTNDLGTQGLIDPKRVAGNIATMVDRIQQESPETQIYIQSILPSEVGLRTLADQQATNELLKELCDAKGLTYIDLWDDLMGIVSGELSYDYLHLTSKGYDIWCRKISEHLGLESQYPADAEVLHGGYNTNSYGMRVSQFGALPLEADDVLFIGDEMVHGCEWHELLHCPKIKNRGNGWHINSQTIPDMMSCIEPMLTGNGNKQQPSKILLYAGAVDISYGAASYTVMARYRSLIDEIRKYAPDATIYCLTPVPTSSEHRNSNVIKLFNTSLESYVNANNGLVFVDIFNPMLLDGSQNPEFFKDNYVYGLGYARISEILAPLLEAEGARATTVDEARAIQSGIASPKEESFIPGTYNLQGLPVESIAKGFVVVNGKVTLNP